MRKYTVDISRYKKKMINMLREFCIDITPEIESEINSRNNEISISNYCNSIIAKYFDGKSL